MRLRPTCLLAVCTALGVGGFSTLSTHAEPFSTPPPLLAIAASPTEAGGNIVGLVLYALIAIGFSFLCSVSEAVLLSITPSHIAALKERGDRSAGLLEQLKENIDRPLAAILSLNTIAHTVGAAGVGAEAAALWGSWIVGWASAIMTLLILVISEIIPKTVGALYWRTLAPWVGHLCRFLVRVLFPLVWFSELLTRLFGGRKQQDVVTRDEVAAMASMSANAGELRKDESRVLHNLLRFRSLTARDIMTPRPVMLSFPQAITVGELLAENPELPVSRIPIYEDDNDQITGFVLKSDILLAQANDKPETQLAELRRDLKAVATDTSLTSLLDTLLSQQAHISLVVDEFGGTAGLVSLEDLMETLLGADIVDEADQATNMQQLARQRWKRRVEALGLDVTVAEQPQAATGTHSDGSSDGKTFVPPDS